MEEDKNYISMIHGDLTRAAQMQNGMPENIGVMSIKTANRTILEASQLPTPRALWDSFWYEGELSCLFADSNVGKSILAVQIADCIARTDNVLYLDFELSEKQFQLRYTDEYGKPYTFPERLYRVSLDSDALLDADFEGTIIGSIEQMAQQTRCRIFIVDNLTYLCCAMEKGDAAGRLMIQLNNLKKRYGLSILVLAHTPKRSLDCPITSNDLAGSKRLYNFFDSVFVIGKSALDGGLRYVKQLKVRYGTFSYDADNVIVYEIEKAVRLFTRQSADATTKAVAGIIIRLDSIFTTTPNAGPPVISLPADNVWRRSPSNRCNRQPSVTYRRTMWRNRRACIATSAVSFQYCLIPITAARQRKCWNG